MRKMLLIGLALILLPFVLFPQNPQPLLTVGAWPRLSFPSPLDSNASLFGIGGGGKVAGEYSLPVLNHLLFADAAIDYGYNPVSVSGMSLSLFTASAGIGVRYPVLEWLSLRALATTGYYFGLENSSGFSHSSGNVFVAGGLGANFFIGSPLILGIEASYRLYGSLVQTIDVNVGVSYALLSVPSQGATPVGEKTPEKPQPVQPQPVPLKGEPQGKGLTIDNLAFENVFPIFQAYYDDHPIGRFTLMNTGKTPVTDVTVSFIVKEYMDAAKKCASIPELKAGESKSVDLYALFKAAILDITEPTKVAAEISVTYTQDGKAVSQNEAETLRIYDRNAMMWDDNRKAAAFVTAKEPAILVFSNNVNALIKPKLNRSVDRNLQTAIAFHDALRLYGISYVSNPLTSYAVVSKDKLAVDTLKFPRQTFEYKSGDCSDLTLLYCALMESVQVETAFVTIPGHIFMAFALKATPEEARAAFARSDELIFRNDKVWVPIEVTERDATFLPAWQEGAKEWRENLSRNQADLYPVHDAWKIYEPVGLRGSGTPPAMPDSSKILADFQADVSRHVELQIYERVAALQAAITKTKESPKSLNSLGVLYARYGLLDKAESAFKRALEKTEYVPALVNSGSLAYLGGDLEKALGFYQRAYQKSPLDPPTLVGMARTSQDLEDYRTAKRSYEELKKVAPDLAQQFAYLDLRGEEATRAAEISGAKEVIIWAEE